MTSFGDFVREKNLTAAPAAGGSGNPFAAVVRERGLVGSGADTSLGTAIQRSGDVAQSLGGEAIAALADYFGAPDMAASWRSYADRQKAEADSYGYQRPYGSVFSELSEGNLGRAAGSAAYAAAENAATVVPGVAAGLVAASAPVTAPAALAGTAAFGALMNLGDIVDTKASKGLERTATNTDFAAALGLGAVDAVTGRLGGLVSQGGKTAMQAFGRKAAGAGVEAAGEGVQEIGVLGAADVQGADVTGLEYAEAFTEGAAAGGVTKATMDAALRGVSMTPKVGAAMKRVGEAIRYIPADQLTDDDIRAAHRVIEAADGDLDKLRNLDERDTGNNAVSSFKAALYGARSELAAHMNELRRYAGIRGNRREDLIVLNALKAVTSNHTAAVPKNYVEKLRNRFGNSVDVDKIVSLSNQVSAIERYVIASGMRGGISQTTRYLDVTEPQGGFGRAMSVISALTFGPVYNAGGALVKGTLVNRLARAADVATNRRSKGKRFVDSALRAEAKRGPVGAFPPKKPGAGPSFADIIRFHDSAKQASKEAPKLQKRLAQEQKRLDALGKRLDAALTKQNAAKAAASIAEQTRQSVEGQMLSNKYSTYTPFGAAIQKWRRATGLLPSNILDAMREKDPAYAEAWLRNPVKMNSDPRTSLLMQLIRDEKNPRGELQKLASTPGGTESPTRTPKVTATATQTVTGKTKVNTTVNQKLNLETNLKAGTDNWTRRRDQAQARVNEIEGLIASSGLTPDEKLAMAGFLTMIDSPAYSRKDRRDYIDKYLPTLFPTQTKEFIAKWQGVFGTIVPFGQAERVWISNSDLTEMDSEDAEKLVSARQKAFKSEDRRLKKALREQLNDPTTLCWRLRN